MAGELHRIRLLDFLSVITAIREPRWPQFWHMIALETLLGANRGRLVTHDEIIEYIWGHRDDGGPVSARGIITVVVFQLRKRGVPIINVHGRGYMIAARAEE